MSSLSSPKTPGARERGQSHPPQQQQQHHHHTKSNFSISSLISYLSGSEVSSATVTPAAEGPRLVLPYPESPEETHASPSHARSERVKATYPSSETLSFSHVRRGIDTKPLIDAVAHVSDEVTRTFATQGEALKERQSDIADKAKALEHEALKAIKDTQYKTHKLESDVKLLDKQDVTGFEQLCERTYKDVQELIEKVKVLESLRLKQDQTIEPSKYLLLAPLLHKQGDVHSSVSEPEILSRPTAISRNTAEECRNLSSKTMLRRGSINSTKSTTKTPVRPHTLELDIPQSEDAESIKARRLAKKSSIASLKSPRSPVAIVADKSTSDGTIHLRSSTAKTRKVSGDVSSIRPKTIKPILQSVPITANAQTDKTALAEAAFVQHDRPATTGSISSFGVTNKHDGFARKAEMAPRSIISARKSLSNLRRPPSSSSSSSTHHRHIPNATVPPLPPLRVVTPEIGPMTAPVNTTTSHQPIVSGMSNAFAEGQSHFSQSLMAHSYLNRGMNGKQAERDNASTRSSMASKRSAWSTLSAVRGWVGFGLKGGTIREEGEGPRVPAGGGAADRLRKISGQK